MNWWNCDLLLKLVKTAFVCIKCNNLRVTLGNSLDREGLSCQILFISFPLREKWTRSLQNFKGKCSFSARKNQFLCVQILWTAICWQEALPCKFLMQQMKLISCFMLTLQIVIGRENTSCFWFIRWQQVQGFWYVTRHSTRKSTCNNVTSVVNDLYRVFYILNLWMCQADWTFPN